MQVDVSRMPAVVEITADAGYQTVPRPVGPTWSVAVPAALMTPWACPLGIGRLSNDPEYRWIGADGDRGLGHWKGRRTAWNRRNSFLCRWKIC